MTDEADDVGFVIDLKTETVTWDGGFTLPIAAILDGKGDEVLDKDDAEYVVVQVPPDGIFITIDLFELEQAGGLVIAFH